MSHYVLISSRDPFTCATTVELYDLAREYRRQGHHVTLFLVENGVLPARAGAHCPALAEALGDGVAVFAEEFSLRMRAIPPAALWNGITPAPLDQVVDALASGHKVVWH
jgi:sulfur relay (sulfurtransferase) complex TusBCD TusD component (DsrE family)